MNYLYLAHFSKTIIAISIIYRRNCWLYQGLAFTNEGETILKCFSYSDWDITFDFRETSVDLWQEGKGSNGSKR